MRTTDALNALDEARAAYEQFQHHLWELGNQVRDIDPHLWHRFAAYPGWDGNRDVGAGKSMTQWLDEVLEVLVEQPDIPPGGLLVGGLVLIARDGAFTVEASALGLGPGVWPEAIDSVLGERGQEPQLPMELHRVSSTIHDGELASVMYASALSQVYLEVLND